MVQKKHMRRKDDYEEEKKGFHESVDGGSTEQQAKNETNYFTYQQPQQSHFSKQGEKRIVTDQTPPKGTILDDEEADHEYLLKKEPIEEDNH